MQALRSLDALEFKRRLYRPSLRWFLTALTCLVIYSFMYEINYARPIEVKIYNKSWIDNPCKDLDTKAYCYSSWGEFERKFNKKMD